MQTQFRMGSYINAYTNETNSLSSLQDLILTLASLCCLKLLLVYITPHHATGY